MKYIKSFKIFESGVIEDEVSDLSCDYILPFILEKLNKQIINPEISPIGDYEILFYERPFYFKVTGNSLDREYLIKYDNKFIFRGVYRNMLRTIIDYELDLIESTRKELTRLRLNMNMLIHTLTIDLSLPADHTMSKFGLCRDRLEEFEVVKDYQIDYISLENLYDFYEVPFDKKKFDWMWRPKK